MRAALALQNAKKLGKHADQQILFRSTNNVIDDMIEKNADQVAGPTP